MKLNVYSPSRQDIDFALARIEREERAREELARSVQRMDSGWKLIGAAICILCAAVVSWVIVVGLFSL